jgi:hypothetical protein
MIFGVVSNDHVLSFIETIVLIRHILNGSNHKIAAMKKILAYVSSDSQKIQIK